MGLISKTNITDQVVSYIRENIENGSWKPGDKLPSENQLTALLGVNRPSIRMALQQFVGVGVLESVQGKGTFVKSNDLDAITGNLRSLDPEYCRDMRKVLEFRRGLEPESCFLAAANASDEQMDAIVYHADKMHRSIGDSREFVQQDILFHSAIAKGTNNLLIERTLLEIFDQVKPNFDHMHQAFGYKDGMYYHPRILAALRKRDRDKAKAEMFAHIQHAIDQLDEAAD